MYSANSFFKLFFLHLPIAVLIFINYLRFGILFYGISKLGRLPVFKDGLDIGMPSLITYFYQELCLVLAHLLAPIVLLVLLFSITRVLAKVIQLLQMRSLLHHKIVLVVFVSAIH